MVFPGKNPSEDREMRHGIRETVQMAPGRVGPVFPQAPMPGPSAPAADHVVPEPDSGVAAPPQVPDHADRPTDPDMAYVAAVAAADAVQVIKYVSRLVARQAGQTVTFMPKPLFGEAGSGMHFHQHLFLKGVNQFYDPQGYSLLSKTAHHYIGGLLLHAPAIIKSRPVVMSLN